jgi:iron complex outermembrane receptor protein
MTGKCPFAACLLAGWLAAASPGTTFAADQQPSAIAPDGEGQVAQTQSSSEEQEQVFPLPTVAVIGKRIDAPPTQIVREVQREDFEAWNALSMADALTYTPGVNVLVGGTTGDASPWIRGFRDRDLLILFDGIPLGDSLEGAVDLNEFALQRVASIKVMKSAPSVIYGANGVGGVIDVLPDLTVPKGGFLDGQLELGTDSRRLFRAEGGKAFEAVRLIASYQHQEADDYSLSGDYQPELNQPAGKRINSDYDRDSLVLHLSAPRSPIGNASLFYNFAESEGGLPIEAGEPEPDFERVLLSRRQTLGFSNRFRSLPLALKLHYNRFDSELGIYGDAGYTEPEEIEAALDTGFGGKVYSTIDTSESNTLVLMAGAQQDQYEAEGQLEDTSQAETLTYTLAVEDQYWVSQRISLAAGGIYTHFEQTSVGDASGVFNPQVSAAWRAAEGLDFHISLAERTRFPKLRELYRRRYGNPDLDPQTALNSEVGVTLTHRPGFSTDFSIYNSAVEDLIERPDRRSIYLNLDDVTFRGFEAASGGWLSGFDFLRLSWSYLDAAEDLPDGGSRQLRSRPEHTVTAEYRRRLGHNLELAFNGIYVRGLYDLDTQDVYTEIPAYFVANMKLSMAFAAWGAGYIAVANLLDEDYQHRLGFPREGRSLQVGLTFGL